MLETRKAKMTKLATPLHHQRVWWCTNINSSFGLTTTGHVSYGIHERGVAKIGSDMKGSGLYFSKRGGDEITSSFVTARKSPVPSYHMT